MHCGQLSGGQADFLGAEMRSFVENWRCYVMVSMGIHILNHIYHTVFLESSGLLE